MLTLPSNLWNSKNQTNMFKFRTKNKKKSVGQMVFWKGLLGENNNLLIIQNFGPTQSMVRFCHMTSRTLMFVPAIRRQR